MKQSAPPLLSIRVEIGPAAFGPGKADLLEKIGETGSISAASRAMQMSYKRAWQLVDEMNRMFARPVIDAAPGGARGGGATLTDLGKQIASAYRRIEQKVPAAVKQELATFAKFAVR